MSRSVSFVGSPAEGLASLEEHSLVQSLEGFLPQHE